MSERSPYTQIDRKVVLAAIKDGIGKSKTKARYDYKALALYTGLSEGLVRNALRSRKRSKR